jgi:ABC-2 type transport system ATP-binding protein
MSGEAATTRTGTARALEREPVIWTSGLTKRYGTLTAVDSLNLAVYPGEIFGLLGQNGAGKTTTILMLLGLTEPTKGEARVLGLDPAREPRLVKRRVGYLPDAVGSTEADRTTEPALRHASTGLGAGGGRPSTRSSTRSA